MACINVVTKQTTFYYQHDQTEITILTILDTRQDLDRLINQTKENET